MILFVGQIERGMRGRDAFQEVDYTLLFGGMCKWVAEIDDCARIPEMIARAYATPCRAARARWCWCCPRTC